MKIVCKLQRYTSLLSGTSRCLFDYIALMLIMCYLSRTVLHHYTYVSRIIFQYDIQELIMNIFSQDAGLELSISCCLHEEYEYS